MSVPSSNTPLGTETRCSVDIHAAIQALVAVLERSPSKRVAVEVQLNAISSAVWGDAAALEASLLKVGAKALDGTKEGGCVSIRTASVYLTEQLVADEYQGLSPGEYIEICIADHGSALSESGDLHLFEQFSTSQPIDRQSKLGLAHVSGVINRHRGSAITKGAIDEGTCITLYLPVSNPREVI